MRRQFRSQGACIIIAAAGAMLMSSCGGGEQPPVIGDGGMDARADAGDGSTMPDTSVGGCSSTRDCVDDNPCTEDVCDFVTNSCMNPPVDDGTACDADGDGCTVNDGCLAGRCTPGEPPSCDDELPCTTDTCIAISSSEHRCEAELSSGCLIEGACYEDGADQPGNACQRCDAASPLVWTLSGMGRCDDGNTCTADDMCQPDGMCVGRASDDSEPNDTRATAFNLAPGDPTMDIMEGIENSDSYPSDMFRRSLYPASDEDWFSFHDSDTRLGLLYPQVELLDIPAGQNYDLCAYYECDTDDIGVSCSRGTPDTSSDGLQGCCSHSEAAGDELVRLSPSCRTTSESGTVYVRVYRVSGDPVCSDYTVRWGDN